MILNGSDRRLTIKLKADELLLLNEQKSVWNELIRLLSFVLLPSVLKASPLS